MSSRFHEVGIVTLVTFAFVMSVVAGGAVAQQTADAQDVGETVTVHDTGTYSIDERVADKREFADRFEAWKADRQTLPGDDVSTLATSSDSETMNVLGSEIEVQTEMTGSFSSGVKARYEGSGSTDAYWWGVDPYNADQIDLSSTIQVDGIEVSITWPPGFSNSGGYSATWSGTFHDDWSASHQYSGWEASSYTALYDANQNDGATFTFGTDAYTVYASATI